MNALLVILAVGLFFYFLHRAHDQVGSCHGRHGAGNAPHPSRAPEKTSPGHPASPEADVPQGWSLASMLLVTLILLLPLMMLHGVASAGSTLHPLLFWAMLLLPFLVVPFLRATGRLPGREEAIVELEADEGAQEAEWRRQRLEVTGPLAERVGDPHLRPRRREARGRPERAAGPRMGTAGRRSPSLRPPFSHHGAGGPSVHDRSGDPLPLSVKGAGIASVTDSAEA